MFSFSSNLWFNNRRVSNNGYASLYLQVVIAGKHDEFPLNLKWPVEFVDRDSSTLLPRFLGDPDVVDYNLVIQIERSKHFEIQRNYRVRNENLDIKRFARENIVFNDRECFTKYMDVEAKRRLTRREIDRKTYQNANATRKLIERYDKTALFKNINLKWMKGFKTFMITTPFEEGKLYKPGTIWARIKETKTYLQLATQEPLIYVNAEAVNFPNPKPPVQTTFLNSEEIRRLMILHRNGVLTDMQNRVLAGFLFTCFSSLRISDLYRVNAKWQLNDGCLDFVPKKNAKKQKLIHIPLMPMAHKFIHKITGEYFDLPSEQEFNRTLKEIAPLANINKRLTSHVGRHTFGYLYMTSVGNQKGLQEVLGHSKGETTERYAHLDDEYQRAAVKKIQDRFSDLL